jgi:Tol biopolymer transport system component
MIELDGGSEIPLIEHPADDRLVGWTPDGRKILFASDRTSRRDLWMIDVTEGTPQGSARLLKAEFDGGPIGFTADGSFYYHISTAASNVYLARLDATGLDFEGEPELTTSQLVGSTTMGDFSPDGKFLVYRAGRAGRGYHHRGPGNWMLVIYSVETGQERILTYPLFRPDNRMCGPQFSPDGRSLLVCGAGLESGRGVYTVDAETGAAVLIDSVSVTDNLWNQTVWSPDGKSIYVSSWTSLSKLDPATGRKTEIYQSKEKEEMEGLDVSPDGRWLAFYRLPNSLVVLPSAGGEPRQVAQLHELAQSIPLFVSWMPDGEHLLFGKRRRELWKVNIETGAQQQIGPEIENLAHATMHPDGRQITFTVEQSGSELWVMENFLPE